MKNYYKWQVTINHIFICINEKICPQKGPRSRSKVTYWFQSLFLIIFTSTFLLSRCQLLTIFLPKKYLYCPLFITIYLKKKKKVRLGLSLSSRWVLYVAPLWWCILAFIILIKMLIMSTNSEKLYQKFDLLSNF